MNFIKSIWNKVKSFFGNLFTAKKEVAIQAAPVKTEAAKAVEVVAATEAQEVQANRTEELATIFNRIAEIARLRNYTLDEAKAAFFAMDEAALLRIERDMKARKYKAPKAAKIAKQYKPAQAVAV